VLLKFIENNMQKSKDVASAVSAAAVRRLFPAFLTSITTFVGLLPMILERSMQAKFLIPMAIALGFGALGAFVMTLFVLPVLYAILVDIKKFFGQELLV
jgi:multidrug efflux pump subunit AcrB